jgi:hypothetical protein
MTKHSLPTFEAIAAVRPIEIADRRASLLSYIKTETRWLNLSRGPAGESFDPAFYAERRDNFIRCFAAIRNGRVDEWHASAFYDVVAYQAAMFNYLIEARRRMRRS